MFNTKKKYQYNLGGFSWKNEELGAGLQQGTGALGSFISQLDGQTPSMGGGIASGALSGAATGAAFGPIGMGLGALAGGVIGGIGAKKQADELERQEKAQREFNNNQIKSTHQVLPSYPTKGVQMAGYYAKYGGKIPSFLTSALAEGGEVAMSDSVPLTDQNGDMDPLASNVSKFEGDSHDAASGGIGFETTSDTIIYSDELRTPDGITYAKQAELWGKDKGKYEKKLKNATSEAEYNTATRMIERLDRNLDLLFKHQERSKNG
jgi:hypothetical protein